MWCLPEGKGGGERGTKGKGGRMVAGGDFTLGGEHIMRYGNEIQNCTLETCMVSLTNVAQKNSVKKRVRK